MSKDNFNPNYTGHKNIDGVYQTIINNIPETKRYRELFFGSGAIFNHVKHLYDPIDVFINDLNHNCVKNIESKYFSCFSSIPAVNYINSKISILDLKDFIFLDPPYLHETRTSSIDIYGNYEMSILDHIALLLTILQSRCFVMIIHPVCELYDHYLKDWNFVDVSIRYHRKTSKERIYMNYDIKKLELKTYDFLGNDFIDRQRINRKVERIIGKLDGLNFHERMKIVNAINSKFRSC